jgi:OOP family OmpA-OmpF porin
MTFNKIRCSLYCLGLAVLLNSATAAFAASPALPSWLPAQGQFSLLNELQYEDFGEGTFKRGPSNTFGDDFTERGHFWRAWVKADPWNGKKVAAAIVAGLKNTGFVPDYLADNGLAGSFHKGSGNGSRYVSFNFAEADPDGNSMDLVEVAPLAQEITLQPPGRKAENVSDKGDFPFLRPLPGWTLVSTSHDQGAVTITQTDGSSMEVPGGYVAKSYRNLGYLSNIAFENMYEAALKKAGWTMAATNEQQGFLFAHWDKNGRNIWVHLTHGEEANFQVTEVPAIADLTLTPPAKTPEVFKDKDPFPYMIPLAGWKLLLSHKEDGPMSVAATQDGPAELVGTSVIKKEYDANQISNYVLEGTYEAALIKAGWTIGQKNSDQGFLYAHYNKNGRNLWLSLSNGERVTIAIADLGSRSLQAALNEQCKVAIYGVNFDFDKSTLRPDAEPVLQQVLGLFNAEPGLNVEIGGHTDNVGQPAYNLKLSASRANAVKSWLVAHGVSDSRLTTHGYGDTIPVVPNDSDENRARNRRVELKKPDCSK